MAATSACLTFSNYLIYDVFAETQILSAEPLSAGCVHEKESYEKCRRVERPNGFFDEFTDNDDFCESFISVPGISLMPSGV